MTMENFNFVSPTSVSEHYCNRSTHSIKFIYFVINPSDTGQSEANRLKIIVDKVLLNEQNGFHRRKSCNDNAFKVKR